jgi:hypothetical protein
MAKALTKKHKMGIAVLTVIFLVSLGALRQAFMQPKSPNKAPNVCIYDPLQDFLAPLSIMLKNQTFLRKLLLALDSLMIDLVIYVLGATWILHGRTKSFIPSLIIFYATRSIVLTISKWPLPRIYLFEDPGVPSYFVDYDKTNDLFFSGHCGGITVMITDCFLNRRRSPGVFLVFLLAYTFFVLAAEGGHYTNDMLVGVIVGFTISRIYFSRKEEAALWYMTLWGRFWLRVQPVVELLFKIDKEEENPFESPPLNLLSKPRTRNHAAWLD